MSNAKVIYDQIQGIEQIKAMLSKPSEDTWIECKVKSNPSHANLDESDKSNFAKCISGFANTSGGVLIFGLEAKKDKNGYDLITGIKPIKSLTAFEAALRELEPRIIERAVPEIEYKKFLTNGNEGVLVIYIPESTNPPHRSLKDQRFYLRAGGSFIPMDLPQIESLVLKNIKPDLNIEFIAFTNEYIGTSKQKSFFMIFRLKNAGRSIAKNVFVRLQFSKGCGYRTDPLVGAGYQRRPAGNGYIALDWYHKNPIHPEVRMEIEESSIGMIPEITSDLPLPLAFTAMVCAENMPLKVFSINLTGKEMLERLIVPQRRVNLATGIPETQV